MKKCSAKDTMQTEKAAHANSGRSHSMSNFHKARRDAMEEANEPPMSKPNQKFEEMRERSRGGVRKPRY